MSGARVENSLTQWKSIHSLHILYPCTCIVLSGACICRHAYINIRKHDGSTKKNLFVEFDEQFKERKLWVWHPQGHLWPCLWGSELTCSHYGGWEASERSCPFHCISDCFLVGVPKWRVVESGGYWPLRVLHHVSWRRHNAAYTLLKTAVQLKNWN